MALDRDTRNELRNTVTRCRRILEATIADDLEGRFAIGRSGKVADASNLGHLSEIEREHRAQVVSHFRHLEASGFPPREAFEQLVREVSYTHLNRLCAYKMLERRKLIRESVGRGIGSNNFKFYLADHPEDERLWSSGRQQEAYRNFLVWLGGTLSEEIGTLFATDDPANYLFPPQRTLDEVLDLINAERLDAVWDAEETIGWIYQYYTPKELRDRVRKESQAPRNSYELSFRNQFYTPNYVVRFLVDNTLGRTWYEMRQGNTRLAETCEYMLCDPDEVFLSFLTDENYEYDNTDFLEMMRQLRSGEDDQFPVFDRGREDHRTSTIAVCTYGYARHSMNAGPEGREIWHPHNWHLIDSAQTLKDYSSQDLMDALFFMQRFTHHTGEDEIGGDRAHRVANEIRNRTLADASDGGEKRRKIGFVPYRATKDPRDIRVLDPASGSGHFLLYSFDLLEVIYEEAYDGEDKIGEKLREEFPDRDLFLAAVPAMILSNNLHGIDIDVRSTQIAALALWLRAQRSFDERGIRRNERPRVSRSNVVCAEPMPGEREMLSEFTASLSPPLLGRLVETVFEDMKLAGEAGSLLKVEATLQKAVEEALRLWKRESESETDRRGNELLFTGAEMDRLAGRTEDLDLSLIDDAGFWNRAESLVLDSLRDYAKGNGSSNASPDATTIYRRRLFADDAERGFAFVEMCGKRFDVVLMNPPFGDASKPSKSYVDKTYPRTKNDVYAAFVERGLSMLHPGGMLGAITSRTGFFLSSFRKWREEIVLEEARPTVVADLGQGVLDTAMVETAAYVLQKKKS